MFVLKSVALFRCSLIAACLIALNAAKPDAKNSDITFLQIKPVAPIPIAHRQQRQEHNITHIENSTIKLFTKAEDSKGNSPSTTEKNDQASFPSKSQFPIAEEPSLKRIPYNPKASIIDEEDSVIKVNQQNIKSTPINAQDNKEFKSSQENIQDLTTPTIVAVKPTLYIQKAKESTITKQTTVILNSTHALTTPLPILLQDQNNYKHANTGTAKPIILISNVPLKPKKSVDFRPSKRYINVDGGINKSPSFNRVDVRKYKSKCRCARIWNCPKLQISVPRCQPDYYMCCF